MKVVFLGPAHPLRGGIAAVNERLAKEFCMNGDEVTLYSFSLQYPSILFPGKSQKSDDPAPEGLDIRQKVNSINPFNWYKVGQEIARLKPDLVIVRYWLPFMGPCLGTICRLISRNGHTKIVALVDNMIPHEKRIGDKQFSTYFTKSVDGFMAMSHQVEQDINLFAPQAPKTFCEHPIYDHYGDIVDRPDACQHLGLDSNYRYLLFFGFIRDYKGLDLLLDAMVDDRIKSMPIKLIVAGEYYGNQEKYEEQIARLGLQDKVISISDYIPNSEIPFLFSAADIVVQPYKSATQSGVTQIGYHFDKPMLVTNVGGLHEIISHEKSGYVVDVSDKAIATALYDFFVNDRKSAFEEETRIQKERFSWSNMRQAFLDLLSRLA